MSEFYEELNKYISLQTDISDIRAVVRRCWFYDFYDYPINVWQGQGRLITSGNKKWLGTVGADNVDLHKTPSISDGRDGTSATYNFSLTIPDYPNMPGRKTYEALKAEQWRVSGRKIICYLALFKIGEGLRIETPLAYFKEFTMMAPRFSEKIEAASSGQLIKKYVCTITAKDGNFGRSEIPGGTYADSIQKERAKQLGVNLDRGSEFLALLANRTYQIP